MSNSKIGLNRISSSPRSFSLRANDMTAAQSFLNLDPDSLSADNLPVVAEALLCDLMPCEFCSCWVERQHEWDFYRRGGVEICDECQEQIDAGTHPLQMSGKGVQG